MKSVTRALMALVVAVIAISAVFFIGGRIADQQRELAENAAAAQNYNSTLTPAAVESAEPTPTVAFIGDSYTAGTGASDAVSRWSTLVSESQGWKELNFAHGGTGYATSVDGENAMDACGKDYCPTYAEVIPEVVEESPSIIVVSGGRNDVGRSIDYEAIAAFYRDLRSALPDAEILAVSPVWDAREAPAELTAVGDAVRESVTAVGGTYVDISQPFTGNPEAITEDLVHPNNKGHQILADAVITGLD